MSDVRVFHREAMRLAQLAMLARHEGKRDQAQALAREAYEHESSAANLIPDKPSAEPTRSILYRSAASLAYQAREYEIAERLVAKGLSGYPPPQVQEQLRDLYAQIGLERHLGARGIELEEEDLELLLQGAAVGPGMVPYAEFRRRIKTTIDLIQRTMQRKMGRVYQRGGRVAREYKVFTPLLSTARRGSFAITIRLGRSQLQMPLLATAAQVIDEIISGVELVNKSDAEGLRQLIQQEKYREHFVVSAREIAPDGDKIRSVALASKTRSVSFTRQRTDITPVERPGLAEGDLERAVRIKGTLDYATSRAQDRIGLTDENGHRSMMYVREGMDDLVKSYYGELVVVKGISDGKRIELMDIESAEE